MQLGTGRARNAKRLFLFYTAAIPVALAVPMTGFFVLLGGGFTAAMRPVGLLGRDLTTVDQVSVGLTVVGSTPSETDDRAVDVWTTGGGATARGAHDGDVWTTGGRATARGARDDDVWTARGAHDNDV